MRYYWGLAVGHVYTHRRKCTHKGVSCPESHRNQGDPPTADHGDDLLEDRGQLENVDGAQTNTSCVADNLGQHIDDAGLGSEPVDQESNNETNSSSDAERHESSDTGGTAEEEEAMEVVQMYGDVDPDWEDDD